MVNFLFFKVITSNIRIYIRMYVICVCVCVCVCVYNMMITDDSLPLSLLFPPPLSQYKYILKYAQVAIKTPSTNIPQTPNTHK